MGRKKRYFKPLIMASTPDGGRIEVDADNARYYVDPKGVRHRIVDLGKTKAPKRPAR